MAKLVLIAVIAVVIALVQASAFGADAKAANVVTKINSCDGSITAMNKTLTLVAKRRIAVRTAKGKGAKKVKRAKKNLMRAQKQGKQVRFKIKLYCTGSRTVSANDARCTLTINSVAKTLDLLYTRKLQYKKLKGRNRAAKKKKRTMKTRLKKLESQVKAQTVSFAKTCGDDLSGNGGGHGDSDGNGGGSGSGGGNDGNSGGNGGGNGGGDGGGNADTTAPGAVIIDGPSGPTNDNTPTIDLTSPENGGHFECKIDGGSYQTVTDPWTLPALEDGTHIIICRYVDGAGNPGPESSITVIVDTTAPGAVTISGPSGATSDTTPAFNLSGAGTGETYMCSVDDGAAVEAGELFVTPELSEGTHTVSCYLVDGAGNQGPVATVTVTIDVTAPGSVTIDGPSGSTGDTTPAIDLSGGDGSGHYECAVDGGPYVTVTPPFNPSLAEGTHTISCRYVDGAGNPGPETTITIVIDTTAPGAPAVTGPGGPTSDNTPSIVISGGGDVTYQCSIDGSPYVTVPAGYTTPVLSDGTHTITCRAVDAAGNTSGGTSIVVTIDTTVPGSVTLTGPSGATNDSTPTYTVTGGGAGVTYQCKVDGGSYANVTSPYTTTALGEGAHTISCRAVDAAGNTGAATTVSVTVDTVAPGSVTVSGPTGTSTDSTPTYTISGGGAGVTYQCKIDGGSYANVTSPYTTAALGEGAHTISCRAVDAAGNTGAATATSVTVDTVGPVVSITDGPPKWEGTHSFTLGANEGASYQCAIDGGSFQSVAASYTTPVLTNGSHSVACRGTDAAGNTGATVTKSFGVFKSPTVVTKSGGFSWGIGCVYSSWFTQQYGCPEVTLSITIPANPNGLTGNYLVNLNGYIEDIGSVYGLFTDYTMNMLVDGQNVASAGQTLWSSMLGCGYADLEVSKTNLSLSAQTEHTITLRLKSGGVMNWWPYIGSSRLSVSIVH
ncbi:MAG: Ig-like domain-containing protein [Solirubrobacterales bacterium]